MFWSFPRLDGVTKEFGAAGKKAGRRVGNFLVVFIPSINGDKKPAVCSIVELGSYNSLASRKLIMSHIKAGKNSSLLYCRASYNSLASRKLIMSHIYSDKVQLAIKLLGCVFCRMTTYTSSDVVDVVSYWNESDSDWSSDENSDYQIDRLDAIQSMDNPDEDSDAEDSDIDSDSPATLPQALSFDSNSSQFTKKIGPFTTLHSDATPLDFFTLTMCSYRNQ